MSLRNKCIHLIFLMTNSVLQTVQAGVLCVQDTESNLSAFKEELEEAHPNFFNSGSDFDPIPSEAISADDDVLPDLEYAIKSCFQVACNYFGILHVGGDKMQIPLKEVASIDLNTGAVICRFSSSALRCIKHHRANVTIFKALYARKPNLARGYLKRKNLPLEGPIFDLSPAGSSRKSSKSDENTAQRSESSAMSATSRLLSKLSKSPSFIGSTCSQMARRRLHQSPTYNNLARGLSKSNISSAYNGVVRSLSKASPVTQVSKIWKSGGSAIKRRRSRAEMLKKTNSQNEAP